MNQKRDTRGKRVRSAIASIVVGGLIVWFLLSKIDPREIPRAISSIPLPSLVIAFVFYAVSVFFKALRFRVILRTGISLRQLFPIVSLYMFFANIFPMRAGELSYVYLLKKQARTPGTKSFASLIIAGVADAMLILVAMLLVGWYLRSALAEGISGFFSSLGQKAGTLAHVSRDDLLLIIIAAVVFLAGVFVGLIALKKRKDRKTRIHRYVNIVKVKMAEVGRELASVSLDTRLLAIVACSVFIIAFRFITHWYLVRSMGIAIGLWQVAFALLFGVLFSLVPIHGPAGLGTVEAPWVIILVILNVSKEDAIASGFALHIMIIMYSLILGIYGILDFRFAIFDLRLIKNRKSKTKNV